MKLVLAVAVLTALSGTAQWPSSGVPALRTHDVEQSLGSQNQTVLNAGEYGVTCNGKADDTKSMQNAIDAACHTGERGKALVLPSACNLKLTSSLKVTK